MSVKDSEELYRRAEYDAIISGMGGDNQDFFVTNRKNSDYSSLIQEYFTSISLIHKLRETRALVGFSRLLPEAEGSLNEKKSVLALNPKIDWLPAIVVRGEGVFLNSTQKINSWLKQDEVQKELLDLLHIIITNAVKTSEDQNTQPEIYLLHTFAHIVINQFSYECGYGSSSLRERIYCDAEFTITR